MKRAPPLFYLQIIIVLYLTTLGSLNDFNELPGIAGVVGKMLNRFGTATNPEQEFSDIIDSHLPVGAVDGIIFAETEEDKQIFCFEVNLDYLIPALEM